MREKSFIFSQADGGQLVAVMMQSGLSKAVLGNIWDLCDIDKDGKMVLISTF